MGKNECQQPYLHLYNPRGGETTVLRERLLVPVVLKMAVEASPFSAMSLTSAISSNAKDLYKKLPHCSESVAKRPYLAWYPGGGELRFCRTVDTLHVSCFKYGPAATLGDGNFVTCGN